MDDLKLLLSKTGHTDAVKALDRLQATSPIDKDALRVLLEFVGSHGIPGLHLVRQRMEEDIFLEVQKLRPTDLTLPANVQQIAAMDEPRQRAEIQDVLDRVSDVATLVLVAILDGMRAEVRPTTRVRSRSIER